MLERISKTTHNLKGERLIDLKTVCTYLVCRTFLKIKSWIYYFKSGFQVITGHKIAIVTWFAYVLIYSLVLAFQYEFFTWKQGFN